MTRSRFSLNQRRQTAAVPAGHRSDSPLPLIRLNSRLNRRLNRYATVLLSGRPYRPPNHLREACKILRVYVRLAERDRKRNPEMYDPRWHLRQLEQQRLQQELEQAIERVYGPEAASKQPRADAINHAETKPPPPTQTRSIGKEPVNKR